MFGVISHKASSLVSPKIYGLLFGLQSKCSLNFIRIKSSLMELLRGGGGGGPMGIFL